MKIFGFLLLFFLGFNCLAQEMDDFISDNIVQCSEFKIPVIVPEKDFDFKMIIEPLLEKSKSISINPCGKPTTDSQIEAERKESPKNVSPKFSLLEK